MKKVFSLLLGSLFLTSFLEAQPVIQVNEIWFSDNGQIRSHDNNHRILFRRDENIMEFREYGAISFSSGVMDGQSTNRMWLGGNGKLGLGTTVPGSELHIYRNNHNAVLRLDNNGFGYRSGIEFFRQRASDQSHVGAAAIWTDSRDTYNGNLIFHVNTACNVGSGASGNYKRLTMDSDTGFLFEGGRVGIGVQADTYKLEVAGTIRAKEIIVASDWADFVFDEDYKLPSLSEVETHIAEFGHLPGIPSGAEVEEQGVSLGEMNARLLQKVEELTLYTLKQDATINQQHDEIEELRTQVALILDRIQ